MGNTKLYLDTNMVLDLFINQAKAHKGKTEFIEPKKFAFLIEHMDKFEFITSFLTKAEIMREMTAGHGMDPLKINEFWDNFMKTLQAQFIDKFEFGTELIDIVAQTRMKLRTMFNYEHLLIAMDQKAYIVSGDIDFVKKVREITKMYNKVLNYIELRRLVDSL